MKGFRSLDRHFIEQTWKAKEVYYNDTQLVVIFKEMNIRTRKINL